MHNRAWSAAVSISTAAALAALSTGCASLHGARYVYQDGEYGVVAIPENTSTWPTFYKEQAYALMEQHFPHGYEVVRAEEVVEGERILDVSHVRESEYDPAIRVGGTLLKIAKFDRKSGVEEKDTLKAKECRIIYRRNNAGGPAQPLLFAGFAARPSLAPDLYLDPNAIERRRDALMLVEAAKEKAAEAKDAAKPAAMAQAGAPPAKSDPAVKVAGSPAPKKTEAADR